MSDKLDVYRTYKADMVKVKGLPKKEVASYEVFLGVWTDHFPHVRLRERLTVFSKCVVCEDLEVGTNEFLTFFIPYLARHKPLGETYQL